MSRLGIVLLGVSLLAGAVRAQCPTGAEGTPRTLVLALDGVSYRIIERAREQGAFEGWPEARPLVTPFPSMTNVGFSAILKPFGAQTIGGYEVRHYDPVTNQISGGGLASKKKSFAWKEMFHVISSGNYAKARIYITPRSKARDEMGDVEEAVLGSSHELILAHIASTDSLTHFRGDARVLNSVIRIAERIDDLRRRHLEDRGRRLDVVLLSDHGNTSGKVRIVEGVPGALSLAGLRPSERLDEEDDVVPVTYGVVGYAALFTAERHAETAARAVLGCEGVDLAAWRVGDREVRVLSGRGEARILWRGEVPARWFAYVPEVDDVLRLEATAEAMLDEGRLDADGYGRESDWFTRTADADYPDALRRLVDSLSGTYVENSATVIFSMEPGWAWGLKSARAGAWFRGGEARGDARWTGPGFHSGVFPLQ